MKGANVAAAWKGVRFLNRYDGVSVCRLVPASQVVVDEE